MAAVPATPSLAEAAASMTASASNSSSSPASALSYGLSGLLSFIPKTIFELAALNFPLTIQLRSNSTVPGKFDELEQLELNASSSSSSLAAMSMAGSLTQEAIRTITDAAAAGAETTTVGSSGGSVYDSVPVLSGAQRGVGNVFNYLTSSWAILCMFMAILMNRTYIYASLRRPLRLNLLHRSLIRSIPIFWFGRLFFQLLIAIHNQTSPTSPHPAPFLHAVTYPTSYVLESHLGNAATSGAKLPGSVSLLWPLYVALCFSHFVEVLVCAFTGKALAPETGMTLFEHSLAFAEAESMAEQRFLLNGSLQADSEVLLIAAISAGSHLTSHVIGLFGMQSKWRLYSTGAWGLIYLGAVGAWGYFAGRLNAFPTVCVVGFVPHLVILFGMGVCASIYLLALLFASISPPGPDGTAGSSGPSLTLGFQNLQANLTLQTLTINPEEDFYTHLLKLGFLCLTAASEATYLNEGRPIRVPGLTWIERERRRILEREHKWRENGFLPRRSQHGYHHVPASPSSSKVRGYGYEVKDARELPTGLHHKWSGSAGTAKGGHNRSGGKAWRYRKALVLVHGVLTVAARWVVVGFARIFGRAGPPQDLKREESEAVDEIEDDRDWLLAAGESDLTEEEIGKRLYHRFITGGSFGEYDDSGDFVPSDEDDNFGYDDDDADSIFSRAGTPAGGYENEEDDEDEYDYEDREATPTPRRMALARRSRRRQRSPTPSHPFTDLFPTPQTLASLISPQTPEQREMSRLLVNHLRSPDEVVLTRSRHRALLFEQDRLLLGPNREKALSSGIADASEEYELENIVLQRRREKQAEDHSAHGNDHGIGMAEHHGAGWENGMPMCVICQSASRTVIIWPCRCLALCEDCRVCLAMNNYKFCSCCRREVKGFSRIYIP